MTALTVLAAMMAASSGQQALAPPSPTTTQAATASSEGDRIPFLMESAERITVPVAIGAQELNFLIDTGAERSAVSREVAIALKLADAGQESIITFSGKKNVDKVRIPLLRVSRQISANLDALTFDSSLIGADGFLGLDALQDKLVDFDFTTNRMTVRSSNRAELAPNSSSMVLAATVRRGRLVFTDGDVNHIHTEVLLDTGSSITMGNLALKEKLRAKHRLGATIPVKMLVMSGQIITVDYGIVDNVTLRGVVMRHMPIAFATTEPFRALGLSDKPALLLGMDALQAFDGFSIDFKRRMVRFMVRPTGIPFTSTYITGA